MPFHFQTFKTRALTAVIFAAVMLAGLLWNGDGFIVLFLIIHFGCWSEFLKLMVKILPGKILYHLLFGLVYISVPVMLMIDLGFSYHELPPSPHFSAWGGKNYSAVLPCGIIFSIWINDTMAYIVGSFIGKTPFSKISPKKTWEGTAGGALLCVLVISCTGWALKYFSAADWIFISSICAVFGTLGDLLESKLKRLAGVKDSGSLMPGHGGFLDRFDSLLVATPFVWLYLVFAHG